MANFITPKNGVRLGNKSHSTKNLDKMWRFWPSAPAQPASWWGKTKFEILLLGKDVLRKIQLILFCLSWHNWGQSSWQTHRQIFDAVYGWVCVFLSMKFATSQLLSTQGDNSLCGVACQISQDSFSRTRICDLIIYKKNFNLLFLEQFYLIFLFFLTALRIPWDWSFSWSDWITSKRTWRIPGGSQCL